MTIALILPVHNHIDFTRITLDEISPLLDSVKNAQYRTIVVDDGSTDGTHDWISKHYPHIPVLRGDGNLWWSGAINMGVTYALNELKADWVLLWNNDIETQTGYFSTIPLVLEKYNTGTVIGSKILVRENRSLVWSMGGYFNAWTGKHGMYGYFDPDSEKYENAKEVDWLTGMGTLVSKEVIDRTGLWDNCNFPQYHGDSDFTYRAKLLGFKVIVDPRLKIYNSVKHSGIEHKGNFKQLMNLMTDIRSKNNLKKNFTFYRLYSKSPLAYGRLAWFYFKMFAGFFKWKFLGLFNIKKNAF